MPDPIVPDSTPGASSAGVPPPAPQPSERAVALPRTRSADPDLIAERIERLTTDALVTRRGYLKILGVLSGGLAVGNVAVALGAFRRRTDRATAEVLITDDVASIPVGGEVRFSYPTSNDPAVLLRLDDDLFVAYSAVCTHLACEVFWRPEQDELFCPCHDGHFDPRNGAPTAGPPTRPLPEVVLEQRGNSMVALGEGRIRQEGG